VGNRLKENDERSWTNENIDNIAVKHFPNINKDATLKRPILYSNWLSKDYLPVDQEELREYVKARLKVNIDSCVKILSILLFNDLMLTGR